MVSLTMISLMNDIHLQVIFGIITDAQNFTTYVPTQKEIEMSKAHIWVRAETKPMEERRALSPKNAGKLVEAGFKVTVEDSRQSIFQAKDYHVNGCEIVPENEWCQYTPQDAYILGLKNLNEDQTPLTGKHIYFAHVYKEQEGWKDVLTRFQKGQGLLYDLEYLIDQNGRRIAAFGYWAGFIGSAVAIRAWIHQQKEQELRDLTSFKGQNDLITLVREGLSGRTPRIIVIGSKGRCGQGAVSMANQVGLDVTEWDMEETILGGPFPEILEHDIFINCVFVDRKLPPFLDQELIMRKNRKLSTICDVTCDPDSDCNLLPIYRKCTNFQTPVNRIIENPNPLDLVAIDHLPSMLPAESSEDFSAQLLPYLLDIERDCDQVWSRAGSIFKNKIREL